MWHKLNKRKMVQIHRKAWGWDSANHAKSKLQDKNANGLHHRAANSASHRWLNIAQLLRNGGILSENKPKEARRRLRSTCTESAEPNVSFFLRPRNAGRQIEITTTAAWCSVPNQDQSRPLATSPTNTNQKFSGTWLYKASQNQVKDEQPRAIH